MAVCVSRLPTHQPDPASQPPPSSFLRPPPVIAVHVYLATHCDSGSICSSSAIIGNNALCHYSNGRQVNKQYLVHFEHLLSPQKKKDKSLQDAAAAVATGKLVRKLSCVLFSPIPFQSNPLGMGCERLLHASGCVTQIERYPSCTIPI